MEQQQLVIAEKAEVVAAAPAPEQPKALDLMQVVARAAADPTVDVNKMQALLTMYSDLQAKQAERQFNEALARVQPNLPRIPKHGQIVVKGQLRSKYARFEDVDEAIRPLLAAEGFGISFGTEEREKGVRITLRVSHIGGHVEPRYLDLPIDTSDFRSAVQNVRSSISFGKRCMLIDFFNVVTEDEDRDGADEQKIDQRQLNTLLDLVQEAGADLTKFCRHLHVDRLEDLTITQFPIAVNALKDAIRVKAQKAAAK